MMLSRFVRKRGRRGYRGRNGESRFSFYEQHFGSLSPHTVEELSAWMEDLSEELVLKALQIAFENNKRTVAYVKGILRGWHGKGFTKVSEVEADTASFRKKDLSVSTGRRRSFWRGVRSGRRMRHLRKSYSAFSGARVAAMSIQNVDGKDGARFSTTGWRAY